jgi:hypothetical protein
MYLSVGMGIKQIVKMIGAYQFAKYIENFIQYSSLKFDSIRRGNYW